VGGEDEQSTTHTQREAYENERKRGRTHQTILLHLFQQRASIFPFLKIVSSIEYKSNGVISIELPPG
jgi:hypothetical protein